MFTGFSTLLYTFNGICECFEPLQSLTFRCYDTAIGLNERCEVAKEWMSWLQEIETWIANLTLCQSLKEVVAILCYELSCKLDRLHFLVSKSLMSDLELISRRWLYFLVFELLCML